MNALIRYYWKRLFGPVRYPPERNENVERVEQQVAELQGPKRRLSAKLQETGFPLGDAILGRYPDKRSW